MLHWLVKGCFYLVISKYCICAGFKAMHSTQSKLLYPVFEFTLKLPT